jgi:DNA helicase HerA-like ATPase
MGEATWAALILAQPTDDSLPVSLRRTVLDEIRAVQAEEQVHQAPSPLSRQYADLLGELLKSLSLGYAIGAWRTAAYLFGDVVSYYRLATLWRAVFSGEKSLPEPLRVWGTDGWSEQVRRGLAEWAMPDSAPPPGPGRYRHPFTHQTLLNSQQLAAYVQFPLYETAGFAIEEVRDFDVEPPPVAGDSSLHLGSILSRGKPTGADYRIDPGSLTTHVLVAGVTGSGKSNTIFRLLREAHRRGVGFLVLEPAKAEYRALMGDPAVGSEIHVFTPGDERFAPLRINPFEVPRGITVMQHVDLLRSVFGASFGMWSPLPQILERCLHEIYEDLGWSLAENANARLSEEDDPAAAFPTLSELVTKVEDVLPTLGYDEKVTGDMQAALVTRLDGLRRGGKGRMLDVRRSIPMSDLLTAPTILELEWMGDDDDKAFLMALLLVRLYEHRRAEGERDELLHLLVIEEAHRLLSATAGRRSEEEADPRGKAAEAFSQLLSEIRAYGQGVVIADQVPVRLIPDVLKNTGLKIAHRTVAADDRAALAGAMAMDDRSSRSLTTLAPLRAAVFGDGDDAPILVGFTFDKGGARPTDAAVTQRMAAWRAGAGPAGLLTAEPFCEETCADLATCHAARRVAGGERVRRTFARIVLSTIEQVDALDRLWPDLVEAVRSTQPDGVDEGRLLRSLAGHLADLYARRRGAQSGWMFADTQRLSGTLRAALLEKLRDEDGTGSARDSFRETARTLSVRSFDPYPACATVCDQSDPPVCLYRYAMADVAGPARTEAWHQARDEDASSGDGAAATWGVCQDAGFEAIEFPEPSWEEELQIEVTDAARRACLCFAQQMLAADPRAVARSVRLATRELQEEAER